MSTLEQRIEQITVAPRVREQDVLDFIQEEHYQNVGMSMGLSAVHPLSLVTMCYLVLQNGFTVHGMSACASPENYNKQIGEEIAKRNAVSVAWGHMGFELRSKLAAEPKTSLARAEKELAELTERLDKLQQYIGKGLHKALDPTMQAYLIHQMHAMRDYKESLAARVDLMKEE